MSERGHGAEFPPGRVARPRSARAWRRAALVAGLTLLAACSDAPSGPRTGALVVTINGLPAAIPNAVTITGPQGASATTRTVSVTDTLDGLTPGAYTVTGNTVTAPVGVYVPTSATQQVEVTTTAAPASATVSFAITTGSIALTVTGLPQGAPAAIAVSGVGGYYRQVTATATLTGLQPGSYQISSNSVTEGSGHVYSPSPIAQTVTVLASEAPRNVTARYALTTGSLEVVVSGLPGQQGANVTVAGPGGYSRALTASTTLVGLFPGTYAVVAASVTGSATYVPTLPSQSVEVSASLTPARAEVAYTEANQPPPPAFNLTIDGMYLTQAVQTYAGAVPLIANMPGLMRVFVKASASNTVGTTVRLRLYNGLALQQTMTLMPNVPGVPTAITEGTVSSSWNALIPASLIKPGLRIVADVDPTNAVTEVNEGDNTFPANGAPFEPRVEFTPTFNLTVVPVFQTTTGLTGNVSLANVDDYLEFPRKVLPIRDYRVIVHETFTSSSPALESNDGNGGWFQVLGEINALRVAEGTSDYYLGIVGTPYSSGMVGLAFTPGKAAVGWDRLPTAAQILAHELGHNLGRRHAPCGPVASPDPGYPHPLGIIGVYGYDIVSGMLKPPGTSDLMGYCGFGWISDYTYEAILNYRATTPNASIASAAVAEPFVQGDRAEPALVVWGRIVNGSPVLEPAFTAVTRRVLPSRRGPHRIEARRGDGSVVFSHAFEGEQPADGPDAGARHFAFALPMSEIEAQSIDRITLTTAGGARTEFRGTASTGGSVAATVEGPRTVRFRVTDPTTRLAVIRDRATRRILAFVRGQGPSVLVRSAATDFDVQFADGVRSRTRVVRAVRR